MGVVGFLRPWSRGPKNLLGVKWGLGPVGSRAMLSRPSRREGQRAWSPLLVRARGRACFVVERMGQRIHVGWVGRWVMYMYMGPSEVRCALWECVP